HGHDDPQAQAAQGPAQRHPREQGHEDGVQAEEGRPRLLRHLRRRRRRGDPRGHRRQGQVLDDRHGRGQHLQPQELLPAGRLPEGTPAQPRPLLRLPGVLTMTATTGWLRRGPALLGGLVAALALALATPAAPASAADRPSIRVNQDEFRPKEAVWVYGKVPGAGKGTKVRVYAHDLKTGERGYQFTVRTSKSGRFSASLVPKNDTSFYVRVKGYDVSRTVTVEREVGKRTRTQRARLAYKLGSTKGKTKKLTSKQRRALKGRGADRVRLRNYKRALLVEVTRGTTVRTWRVDGKIRKAYLKAGGPTGKYGLP